MVGGHLPCSLVACLFERKSSLKEFVRYIEELIVVVEHAAGFAMMRKLHVQQSFRVSDAAIHCVNQARLH